LVPYQRTYEKKTVFEINVKKTSRNLPSLYDRGQKGNAFTSANMFNNNNNNIIINNNNNRFILDEMKRKEKRKLYKK